MKLLRLIFAFIFIGIAWTACQNGEQEGELKRIDSLTSQINWILDKDQIDKKTLQNLQQLVWKNKNKISLKTRFKAYQSAYLFYYYKEQDAYSALNFCDSMISLMRTAPKTQDNIRELAGAYNSKGDILYQLRAFEEAYRNFLKAKELNLAGNDLCMNSNYSDRMAMILFHQEKYDQARKYFQTSLKEIQTCNLVFGELYRVQGLYNNIALSFGRSNIPDSAIKYYYKALDFVDVNDTIANNKKHYAIARAVIRGNLGGEYLIKKQYATAEDLLKKSIAVNIQEGYDQKDAGTAVVKLINLYFDTNRLEAIAPLLADLKRIGLRYESLYLQQAYHKLFSTYFQRKKQYSDAINQLLAYNQITDSIDVELQKIERIDVDERIRDTRNKHEIDQLKDVSEAQQKYIYALTGGAILILAVLVLIVFMWRISKRNYKNLALLKEQLQEQKKQLETTLTDLDRSHSQKDKILKTVAHDLRNPIGGISSLIELMRTESLYENSADLVLIDHACNDALTLIEELMEAADNQDNKNIRSSFSPTDIVALSQGAIELLQFKAKAKSIRLDFMSDNSKLILTLNKAKIARVISNLLTNAIKFSEANATITLSIEKQAKAVVIGIADNGIGIPQDYQNSVFELFTSHRRLGTNGEKSFGLGLSICKQIVEAHQGRIWYQPNQPKGTVFLFSLPLDGVFR